MNAPDWQSLFDHGQALLDTNKPDAVIELLQPVLTTGGPLSLWRMLAHATRQQGRFRDALALQKQLVDRHPAEFDLHFDLAETLLLLGEFDRGWREYRFRYRLSFSRNLERKIQMPRWDGRPIPGRTLLIHDEQGFGDSLQFLRLVAQARELSGARVVLEVMPELLPLAQRIGGYDQIIARGQLPPTFDCYCELMSLPQVLKLQLSALPGKWPYLTADTKRMEYWRQRLKTLPRPWVALVWAGRPEHTNDRYRSLKLADLAPLARPDISFIALQKGPAADQAAIPPVGMSLLALDAEIRDFEDSAAILSLVDLLISVDSSPVHLAGALGQPAWVLLPFVPDWRWLTDRDDSPWYPSLRLFRQPAPGDWPITLATMATALDAWRKTWPSKTPDGK